MNFLLATERDFKIQFQRNGTKKWKKLEFSEIIGASMEDELGRFRWRNKSFLRLNHEPDIERPNEDEDRKNNPFEPRRSTQIGVVPVRFRVGSVCGRASQGGMWDGHPEF